MTGTPGQPDGGDLTSRVFRALYAEYDLHAVADTGFVAVPKGTAWHAGRTIGQIARQISGPGHGDAPPAAPAPAPLPARTAPAPADAPAAVPATGAAAPGRTPGC